MLDTNVIHCGDCAEVMRNKIPDDSIDLTVTSPPYDNLRDYNGYTFDFEAIAAELWRVTKPGGVVVWVVGDATVNGSETCTSAIQKLYFRSLGFNVHDTMIYNRQSQYPDKSRYCADFEYMIVFSNGVPSSINLIADKKNLYAGTKIKGGDRQRDGKIKKAWANRNGVRRKRFGVRSNIWKFTANSQTSIYGHPAPFPEALARDHIISWSNLGDVVLDPMCGSGTTLKMAKELSRQWIGIDCSQEYCDLAQRRIDGARVPLPGLIEAPKEKPNQLSLLTESDG